MDILKDYFGLSLPWFGSKQTNKNVPILTPTDIAKSPKGVAAPARTSDPGTNYGGLYTFDDDKYLVHPGYQYELIPLIRRLSIGNQSVSQALANIVNLANTGHRVIFNSSVDPIQVDKMREHLDRVVPLWQYGTTGRHGLANKLISQAMISGAVCGEVIVNQKIDGVYRFLMPNPETIRMVYNKTTITYEPHQAPINIIDPTTMNEFGLKKLNPNSFKYFPINGDTESPYGNPPYLPVIGPIEDQKIMLENIKFIIKQVGIMGFWEILVDKPTQNDLETDASYKARVEDYLRQVKNNMMNSYRDGMMVGIRDEHEFKFNTATASASGVSELFSQNENLVSSALKQDPSMSGGGGGAGKESGMTIVFTKLLSELKNIQITVGAMLKFAYDLELRLAGFNYNTIDIEFDQSTVQDDLKVQQGQEIKIRNARQLRADGIIGPDQHADILGHEKPFSNEPDPKFAPLKGSSGDPNLDSQKKAVREKGKNVSDKKVRDKNKPQGIKNR